MFHEISTILLAGKLIPIFSPILFLHGVVIFFPLACIITIAWIFFYCIRNNLCHFFAWIFASAMIAAIWIIVLTGFFHFLPIIDEKIPFSEEPLDFTTYSFPEKSFQLTKNGIYYFVKIDDENKVTGVRFPQIATVNIDMNAYTFTDEVMPINVTTENMHINTSISDPQLLKQFASFYRSALQKAKLFYQEGILSYVKILAMVFAFLGLWGLAFLSVWRLINVLLVFLGTIAIVYLNFFLLTSVYFQDIKAQLFVDGYEILYSVGANALIGVIGLLLFFAKMIHNARTKT
ncbi:MAG: hypothetical protein ACRC4W_08550 [Treponemataceae bacterium]